MTEPVVCHEGRCKYKEPRVSIDDCIDCDLAEQIEHDLLRKDLSK